MKETSLNTKYLTKKYEPRKFVPGLSGDADIKITTTYMKTFKKSNPLERFMRGIQATGYILAIGFLVILTLAWGVTGQLFQLGERIAHNGKLNKQVKQ